MPSREWPLEAVTWKASGDLSYPNISVSTFPHIVVFFDTLGCLTGLAFLLTLLRGLS